MSFHRSLFIGTAATFSLAAPPPAAQSRALPLDEQIAIYTRVLRAEAAMLRLRAPTPPLLLVPFLDSVEVQAGRPALRHRPGPPLDSALVKALLDSGVVSGLCWPVAPRHCAGSQRGLGVHLARIELGDSNQAWVSTHIQVMQAERDNTYLLDSERGGTWRFLRIDGRWVLSMPTAKSGPDVPSN